MFDVQFTINDIKREGANENAVEIAKNALREGIAINIIAKITGLTVDIIQQMKQELDVELVS